jgi:tRNA (guanine6-N2)-methyltransferase
VTGGVPVLARSVRGLEWVAAAEITQRVPAADRLAMAPREVTFRVPEADARLLALRTVDDVFLGVGTVSGVGTTRDVPPVLAGRVARLDWALARTRVAAVRDLPERPHFDVVASTEGRRNYNRFAVENAVGPALAPLLPGTYVARTAAGLGSAQPTDLTVRVLIRDDAAIVAVRLARRPLHRREYKQDTGPGTLHPPVAAALALLASPAPGATVVDPFCGDGTIAIETALGYPDIRVLASDLDPARLANARRNARRAGVVIELAERDAAELPRPAAGLDAVLTNPPWNLAVDARGLLTRSLDRFWRRVPAALAPGGRLCAVTDVDLDAPGRLAELGVRPALATQVRLAGRVSHVLVAAPGDTPADTPGDAPAGTPPVPAGLADRRREAIAAGVVTEDGF